MPDVRPAASRVAAWDPPDLRSMAPGAEVGGPGGDPVREHAAYALGWEEGRADLIRAGEIRFEETAGAYQAAREAMSRVTEALQARFVESVNIMAVAVAWHLMAREFAVDPTYLRDLVGRALTLAPLAGPVTVRLHPDDLAVLQELPGGLPAATAALELSWVGDPAVHSGGCVIEGPSTVLDGRIDRALLDIHERLGHG